MQSLDNRTTSLLANLSSVLGRLTADLGFNGVKLTELRQHPGSKRRLRRDMEFVEGAPHVDHPNTIGGLRFVVSVPFASRMALRQRRSLLAG